MHGLDRRGGQPPLVKSFSVSSPWVGGACWVAGGGGSRARFTAVVLHAAGADADVMGEWHTARGWVRVALVPGLARAHAAARAIGHARICHTLRSRSAAEKGLKGGQPVQRIGGGKEANGMGRTGHEIGTFTSRLLNSLGTHT